MLPDLFFPVAVQREGAVGRVEKYTPLMRKVEYYEVGKFVDNLASDVFIVEMKKTRPDCP